MLKKDINRTAFFENIGSYIVFINSFLSKEYPLEPLGNHIKMIGGYAFKSKDYINKGVPVIRISDFQNERIELSKVRFYEENDKLEKCELLEGDIIIAMTGGTIGKLAIVQKGLGKLYLNQRVGKFQVKSKEYFDKEFVYWMARGIQDKIQSIGYGGAQPNVSNSQIEKLEFPFPKKETQRTIVSFLNDLKNDTIGKKTYFDAETEREIYQLHEVRIKSLELVFGIDDQLEFIKKLRQSILQDAVQGKLTKDWRKQNPNTEPASKLLKRIKAEKEKLIVENKIKKEKALPPIKKEEIPFEIPEGWSWCPLGDVIKEKPRNGYSPRGVNYETQTKSLKLGATTKGVFNPLEIKYLDEIIPKKSHLWLNDGDILIQRSNSIDYVGVSAIYRGSNLDFVYPDLMMKVRCSIISMTDYLFIVLSSKLTRDYYRNSASGTSSNMPKINQGIVISTKIPTAPLDEQKVIVKKVEQLMQYCDSLEKEIKDSKSNSNLLMQSVLSELLGERKL